MTKFSAAAQKLSAAVDGVYGEPMRITPMRQGRYKASEADPDRAIRTLTGVYREIKDHAKITDAPAGRDFDHKLVVSFMAISFDRVALAGISPRAGDRIARIDWPSEPLLEITAPDVTGSTASRASFIVVAVAS